MYHSLQSITKVCQRAVKECLLEIVQAEMRERAALAVKMGVLACCWEVTSAAVFAVPSTLPLFSIRQHQPTCVQLGLYRPALGTIGRRRTESLLQARDDPGDFMARLLHKYVVEGERKEELKADVKKSYPLLPDMAMDWMLTQATPPSHPLFPPSISCA